SPQAAATLSPRALVPSLLLLGLRTSPCRPTLDAVKGLREFVVGTGGKNHIPSQYSIQTTKTNLEASNPDTFGVLKLTLHSDGYDGEFVPEPGKTFTDKGSTPCH